MATQPLSKVVDQLRRIAILQDGAGLTDGQLLERFIALRDDAAFTVLVRRHAAMVWSVCRRILRGHHDAEDVFQATFFVLARKAASIESRELLANWLFGVARLTALKAKAANVRRKTREKQMVEMPEPQMVEIDLCIALEPFLDGELARLPEKYRVAIVLCDLEGKTRKQAALQLGLPEGTVASRLARARTMLAKRLARHGVAVSGGALAIALLESAARASLPTGLVSKTIKAALLFTTAKAAALGFGSATAVEMAQGVLKSMLMTKLKPAMAVLVILGAMAFTFGVLASGQGDRQAKSAGKLATNTQKPKQAKTQNEAEKLYFAMEKTIRAAKSLKVVCDGVIFDADRGEMTKFQGTMQYAAGNKAICQLAVYQDGKPSGGIYMQSDGKETRGIAAGGAIISGRSPTQPFLNEMLGTMIARVGVCRTLGSRDEIKDKDAKAASIDIDKILPASDFKLGVKGTFGEIETQWCVGAWTLDAPYFLRPREHPRHNGKC